MMVRLQRSLRVSWFAAMLTLSGSFAGVLLAAAPANLVEAASAGDLAVVNRLLSAGADVNARESVQFRYSTPLIAAALAGHLQVVEALLAAKADVNALDGPVKDNQKYGSTALMLASGKGHLAVVQALLAANANVQIRDAEGTTALMLAAESNHPEVVKVLLAAKADPSPMWKEGGGRSALVKAMMAGNLDVAMLLVEAGATVNDTTNYSESALRIAARGNTPRHLALVKALLARQADTEAGQVPKRQARDCNRPRELYVATDRMAAPRPSALDEPICLEGVRTAEGTALGLAVAGGNVEMVRALLDARAQVNAPQSGWQTPLMIAVRAGRADLVRMLLAAGADRTMKDDRGSTALVLARDRGNQEIVDLLDNAGVAPRR
jgi:ankyrin repeat protein